MKYPMANQTFITKLTILLFLLSLSFLVCSLPEVVESTEEESSITSPSPGKGNPELLRLTYDLAFRPPPGYTIEEKSSLHEKGNIYKIRFPIELNGFTYLKISSTNSENSSLFEYEVSKRDLEKAKWRKYYYLPVQGKSNSATVTLFYCGTDLSCVRWEWIYNGFLVVFESKGRFKEKDINQKEVAENYHQIIEKHLLVY